MRKRLALYIINLFRGGKNQDMWQNSRLVWFITIIGYNHTIIMWLQLWLLTIFVLELQVKYHFIAWIEK